MYAIGISIPASSGCYFIFDSFRMLPPQSLVRDQGRNDPNSKLEKRGADYRVE